MTTGKIFLFLQSLSSSQISTLENSHAQDLLLYEQLNTQIHLFYSSGRGSRAGSLTPEPAFCKPAPSKEDAKQLKEEMNEQHAKLYTKLKVNNCF